jgi:hypothetical protein
VSIGQKQSIGSLRYFLYDRPLHPELFDIYHDHHIVKPAYESQIWVTGCSHVIGFFREGQSLVEVIADADAELSQHGRLLELPFRGERDHERKKTGGIHYMMNFQVETMSPAVYARTHHELARMGTQRGLFVPFPMWMSRGLTPFTYIDYSAKPNELHVFAFHAFPEDLTIIKVQSIFELG